MPDESSTPPADTQAPPSEPVSAPVIEPTPPPEAAAPAPEITQQETPAPSSVQDYGRAQQAEVSESVPESVSEPQAPTPQPEPPQSTSPAPQPPTASAVAPTSQPSPKATAGTAIIGELLVKARAKIQARRRKKLDRIMDKLTEKGKITNDEVERLLRVSDATATRYLDLLEKENKIRQEGKTGKYVTYVRV
jgi:hypothetical protein